MWPLLIGAGIGALMNKKDPLKGALLGGAVGATGGAAATGGLLGGGSAAAGAAGAAGGAATAAAEPVAIASGNAAFNTALANSGAATTGGGVTGLLGSAMPAMQAAGMAKGLIGGSPQEAPQAPQINNDGGQGLAQLYGSIQQGDQQAMQAEMQKRMKNQGLFGGGNGWSA